LSALLKKENTNTLDNLISQSKQKNSFTFEQVGEVIEDLVEDFYRHKFSKLPYSVMDKLIIQKMLNDTVKQTNLHFYNL
jgi:hypothetical protein